MREEYVELKFEVVEFEKADIITASNAEEWDWEDSDWGN